MAKVAEKKNEINNFKTQKKGKDAINALFEIEKINEQVFWRIIADLKFIANELKKGATPGPLISKPETKSKVMRDAFSGMFDDVVKTIEQLKFISRSLEIINEQDKQNVDWEKQNIAGGIYPLLDSLWRDLLSSYEYYEPIFSKIT